MRAEPSALGWMLALSVTLHLAAVAQFGRRPHAAPRSLEPTPVEVTLPSHEVDPVAPAPAEEPAVTASAAALPSPSPVHKRHAPQPSAAPEHANPAAGTNALTRTLLRVAATPELSVQQKRKAMLALLRTWEGRTDPEAAERLIDQMLQQEH